MRHALKTRQVPRRMDIAFPSVNEFTDALIPAGIHYDKARTVKDRIFVRWVKPVKSVKSPGWDADPGPTPNRHA
jgi:hypothetical protein